MNTLVIDIGGTNIKLWKTGESDKVKFPSGKSLTPEGLVDGARKAATGWAFDRVSIGYPGEVRLGRPTADPYNLGRKYSIARSSGDPVILAFRSLLR
jgi:polyphosphate glucokinase